MERIENDDPIKDEHHKNNASNDLKGFTLLHRDVTI